MAAPPGNPDLTVVSPGVDAVRISARARAAELARSNPAYHIVIDYYQTPPYQPAHQARKPLSYDVLAGRASRTEVIMPHNRQGACAVDTVDNDGATSASWAPAPTLTFELMANGLLRNIDASWNNFSSHDYWHRNYRELQPEDQEIIRCVGRFFAVALAGRPRVQRGIDVGSGTNLYPALLMLPWTEKILLTDYSDSNVSWLRSQFDDDDEGDGWEWRPFWRELQQVDGYDRIDAPRKQLNAACDSGQDGAGVEHRSVFDLPTAGWDLGTMFFVAESITEDPLEFRAAVARFVGAMKPGAPFAAAFMAGSDGYRVAGTDFPALPISVADVGEHLTDLGAVGLNVERPQTEDRVREGYEGMIVATGFACGQRGQ